MLSARKNEKQLSGTIFSTFQKNVLSFGLEKVLKTVVIIFKYYLPGAPIGATPASPPQWGQGPGKALGATARTQIDGLFPLEPLGRYDPVVRKASGPWALARAWAPGLGPRASGLGPRARAPGPPGPGT